MNIFVYHRPVHKEFYEKLAHSSFPDSNIITISDFRYSANIWLGRYLYSKSKVKSIFNEIEKNEIYLRCRFLRSLDKNLAYEFIDKIGTYVMELFSEHDPEYIIGAVIDNYTMDIIERISRKNNVPYISFCGHFFNGYSWITRRGELNKVWRTVSNDEVEGVLQELLNKEYVPSYHANLKPTVYSGYKFYVKQMIKKYMYLPIKRSFERDRWNYYYNTFFLNDANLFTASNFVQKNIDRYFSSIEQIEHSENQVLLPLHFRPEATTDYWCDDPECGAFYEESVIDVIKKSSKNINFLVKEHPTMYMKRSKHFYEKLLSFSNVILLHPLEHSNEALEKVDTVYVYTGSIGVEALLRGKRVICRSVNYYSKLHPNAIHSNYISDKHLLKEMHDYDNRLFIREILQGTIPGKMFNNKDIMKSEINKLFPQIKNYCESLNSKAY
ncbi:hypothetical protein ACOSZF_22740 [Cytobacillus firmus]|uniref:capsular polysaccharide export protein, LipB/KpsS family n=1 Tax=Cytobacillus firmus TaxID=1399 RepID=UPI003BA34AEF